METVIEELIAAGTEQHVQRLAAISASHVEKMQTLRQAVTSGDYDKAKAIIRGDIEPAEQSSGSVDTSSDGVSPGGSAS